MGNCVGGKGKKDPTILTEEEIKLLLENTKLNRAQINALHQNFLKECPSGKLTKKDFVKLFKEVHPSDNKKEKADKFCEYVFKVIDRESLGYISFNDFVLCFSLTSYGDFKQKCEFAFRLYDLDKDNKISKKEMTQVLVALYDLSGITDRKKDKAPAKKVQEIMNLINTKTDEQNAAQAPESAAPEDPKAKKAKKPKKQKPRDFITREQFIDACSEDEALKKLFVDSIFAATSAEPSELEAEVNRVASTVQAALPEGVVDLNSIVLDAPAFEVTTTSKVECVEFTEEVAAPVAAEAAPAAEVVAEVVEEVKAEVEEVKADAEVKVEVKAENVAEALLDSVKAEEPVKDEAVKSDAAVEVVEVVKVTTTETVTTTIGSEPATTVETKTEEVAVTNVEGETVTTEKETVTVTEGDAAPVVEVTETVTSTEEVKEEPAVEEAKETAVEAAEKTEEVKDTVSETSDKKEAGDSLFKSAVTSKIVEELSNVIGSINVSGGEVKVEAKAETKPEDAKKE